MAREEADETDEVIFIGIDPGKQGAIAALLLDGTAELTPMPIIPAATKGAKRKSRPEYDISQICRLFADFDSLSLPGEPLFVSVEKSQPMPPKMPGGTIANYHRGVARGFEWLLVGMGIPCQLVAPRTWQRVMHAGTPGADTKQKSIIAAQRLFPAVDLRRSERARKPDDGMAEALLIAEYGRRTWSGS